MQGKILSASQGLILGDDGNRYAFTTDEWQDGDVSPEVGMRVDFEVRGSGAADIYPIPGASPMPPVQPPPPAAPPATSGVSRSQPHTTPSVDERFKATLRRTYTELDARYSPIREKIGNYGVIATGIALLAAGALIRFDIFEAMRDLIGIAGMLVGAAMAAVGIFMLGKDEGWWGESDEYSSPGADAPASPGVAPGSHDVQLAGVTSEIPPATVPIQARQPQHVPFRQVPALMFTLAMLPAVLLIITVLPITPWFSYEAPETDDRGRWDGESYYTEYESLWDTIARAREIERGGPFWSADITWEAPFGAYVLAVVGAMSLGIAIFLYRQSNQGYLYRQEGDEAFNDRLDLFLSVSIFICALTLVSALFALPYIEIAPLLFSWGNDSVGYHLGPALYVLAISSIVGYLVFLVANKTTRNRFANIRISTFVNFKGRVRRPIFALATALVHVQNLMGITVTLYVLGLRAPFGILIDLAEQSEWVFHPLRMVALSSPSSISLILINPVYDTDIVADIVAFVMEGSLWVLQILITYVWLALCAKRYHDLDKSGWWALVGLIPIVGPIWILIQLGLMKGTPGHNRYGPPQEQHGTDAQPAVVSERQTGPSQDVRQFKKCPYCGEDILYQAIKCRYCLTDIP